MNGHFKCNDNCARLREVEDNAALTADSEHKLIDRLVLNGHVWTKPKPSWVLKTLRRHKRRRR